MKSITRFINESLTKLNLGEIHYSITPYKWNKDSVVRKSIGKKQEAEVIDSVLNAVRRIFDMYRLDTNECRRTLVRWICQRNEMKIRETNERVKAITERLDTINKTEQALFEQKLQQEISQFCESPKGRILPQTEVHLSSGSSGQNRAPYTEMPAASDHHDL